MPTSTYTNNNGKLVPATEALIAADNGAFRYGLGLFETLLVRDGKIQLATYHWARLFAGLQQLYFDIPPLMTPDFLEAEVMRTVSKNHLSHLCRVRLQLYAGSGGIFETTHQHPLYVIECYPLTPETLLLNENGLILGMATNIRKSNDALSNLKTSNALIYAIAARQAKENRWNDALIQNTTGNIIESAIANVFWVKDGVTFTPPLAEGCVAGVMRQHILNSIPITETPLTTHSLQTADEVFLTNAIKPIRWVSSIKNTTYANTHTRTLFNTLFR